MLNNNKIIRVSELNRYIKNLIGGDPNLQDIRIGGELSNFKHHRSGHMYFTIKDGASSLRCVFFHRENRRCLFTPTDGMELVLTGHISVYEPDGVYQLYVREMEPAGVGSLYLAFEQLKTKLAAEGLFDEKNKKKIPLLPRKIALVTSATGAALQDMLSVFKYRFPALEILVVESLVQGAGGAADLVRSLEILNARKDSDLIILARGGGSIEDLWPFNEESLARAIYRSKIPVISAVGHETDFTIADFVADKRAPTPTAAAQMAVPDLEDLLQELGQLRHRAATALLSRLQRDKQKLDQVTGERFFMAPVRRVALAYDKVELLYKMLKKEIGRVLQLKNLTLTAKIDQLDSFSPLKIMNRGYSYCRDDQGRIIRSVKDLKVGRSLQLTFADGRAYCRTEKIEEGITFEG